MRDRAKAAKRMLAVQRHLHDLAETKYLRLSQEIERLERDQVELAGALSAEGALHGLFIDITVKRIDALRRQVAILTPELKRLAKELLEQAGRQKNTERLVKELNVAVARADEKASLDEMLEVMLVQGHASLKQDH